MNATKHTPGPWRWHFNTCAGRWQLTNDVGDVDVQVGGPPDVPLTGDQRLIAAAPDLLAACEEALRVQTLPFDHPDKRDLPKVLRAALAKATGK